MSEACLKVRSGKRIVQGRPNDDIGWFPMKFGKKLPSGRMRLKLVSLAAAMLDENDVAGLGTDLGGQAVDTIQHAAQVMLGSAAEKPDLHVNDKHRVHGHA